ncbi:trypsin-1 [Culicoides brevitarsis]|uniref:trypsin-1 n=1 Tax=Culicoides brevitarsis TaxID=469753 RepID=UPI00307C1706
MVFNSRVNIILLLLLQNSKRSVSKNEARFLFDSLFGLESLDDLDTDSSVGPKSCSCDCGKPNLENRIIGGVPTGLNEYPWVARLVYDGQFHCGASVLNQDYVLSAAHCVYRLKRNKIRVVLGDHNQFSTTDTSAKMRAVISIKKHKGFDTSSYNNDIALLKLRKPITFSRSIRPICLPKEYSEYAGNTGIVAGWGRTSEGGSLPAEIQKVEVPILSNQECKSMKYKASRITSNMLCAGGKTSNKDSCQGDSGGALVVNKGGKHEIVGIVSWGIGCGRKMYPGVYTRVANYIKWIKNNLEDSCFCDS